MSRGKRIVLTLICLVIGTAGVAAAEVVLQVALIDRLEHRAAYQELFSRFEAEHPNIRIEIVSMPGGYLRDERLGVLFAGGQMPDIWGEGGATATYYVMNWLLDLSPFVARDRTELNIEDFLSTAWANVTRGDQIIGLPWGTSTSALAYNRRYLDQAGLAYPPVSWNDPSWNYDQLVHYARQLTKRTANGLVETYGFDQWVWEDYLLVWAQQFGGDWFDAGSYETGIVDQVVINSPETLEAYEQLHQLMHERAVMPPPVGAPWVATPTHWEPFAAGNIATRITSSWAYQMYIDAGLQDWGIAAIPEFPAGRQSLVANDAWHIWRGSEHPEEAWALLKFLASQESMEYFSAMTLFGPARISALNPYVSYLAEKLRMSPGEVVEVMVGSQAHGQESQDHVFHGWANLRAVPAEVLGRVWTRDLPLASALDEAQRRLQLVADELRSNLNH